MAEKNVSTSFPVCASPESWSKYTTYTHKMCTCTPTIDHFVGSFWPQNKFVPKFGPFAKKVAILGRCYAVKQLTIIFQDYDSGLRSLMGREIFDPTAADAVYTYTNFIIGTKLEAQYSFQVKQAMVTLQRM